MLWPSVRRDILKWGVESNIGLYRKGRDVFLVESWLQQRQPSVAQLSGFNLAGGQKKKMFLSGKLYKSSNWLFFLDFTLQLQGWGHKLSFFLSIHHELSTQLSTTVTCWSYFGANTALWSEEEELRADAAETVPPTVTAVLTWSCGLLWCSSFVPLLAVAAPDVPETKAPPTTTYCCTFLHSIKLLVLFQDSIDLNFLHPFI